MLAGAANAIIGYVGRVMLYYNPFNFAAFMLQISESFLERCQCGWLLGYLGN
jgi:hypothetical protein